MNAVYEDSLSTVIALDREIWHEKLTEETITRWIEQFDGQLDTSENEQILALTLLSHFMFFGRLELDVLCQALYHEHLWYPIVSAYRQANGDTLNEAEIDHAVRNELNRTLIVGPGNAAESGAHLLYQFRIANDLPLKLFVSPVELLHYGRRQLRDIRRIVLLDDLCGSGTSAERFDRELIKPLQRRRFGTRRFSVSYLTLFATRKGIGRARHLFHSGTAMLIDESHQVFGASSRYFRPGTRLSQTNLNIEQAGSILRHYGSNLYPSHPLGYRNGQLLLGFAHNMPNNTLPVFWSTAGSPRWQAVMPRHGKRWDW